MIDNGNGPSAASDARRRDVPRRGLLLGLLALALVSACGTGPAPTPPADGSPTPGGATGDTQELKLDDLVLRYPADWRAFHYEEVTSFYSVAAWLGTVEVHDPCTRTADTVSCGPGYVLSPHSLVVRVDYAGGPMMAGSSVLDPPAGATPITVDGLPGYVEDSTEPDPGGQTGATKVRTWTLARPGGVSNTYRLIASVRGPLEDDLLALVGRVVEGARYDPAPAPLPSGPTAAHDAAAVALGELARTADPPDAWACFPVEGSRTARVTAFPYGPALRTPQQATCTTSIEPTPLRLWRLTLELRLASPDPDAGLGQRMTIFLAPDGSPGESMSEGIEAP